MKPPMRGIPSASQALGLPFYAVLLGGPWPLEPRPSSTDHALLAMGFAPDPCLVACALPPARCAVAPAAVTEYRT